MNKKGFTLVELLVATAIFLAATIAFGHLLKVSLVSVNAAARLNRAACELQDKMEGIRALPFAKLRGLDGDIFADGRGRVAVTPVLADLLSVRVELSWDARRAPLKIISLRSKYQ